MADISSLIRERARYERLTIGVNELITKLHSCINSLESATKNIGEYYNVDNESYDKGKLNSIQQELISKKDNLSSVILPAISSEISSINADIRRAEEEERARREAEEAAKAEAAALLALKNKKNTVVDSKSKNRMTNFSQ